MSQRENEREYTYPLHYAFSIPVGLDFFKSNHWGRNIKKSAALTTSLFADPNYVTVTQVSDLPTHPGPYTDRS